MSPYLKKEKYRNSQKLPAFWAAMADRAPGTLGGVSLYLRARALLDEPSRVALAAAAEVIARVDGVDDSGTVYAFESSRREQLAELSLAFYPFIAEFMAKRCKPEEP